MAYWLLKSEPDDWSWAEQIAKGRDGAEWTGIRNFSARNHLRAMRKGEQAFFYHTGNERAIVGIVEVIAEAHPDSTDSAWPAIDVAAVAPLPTPVGLDRIKADRRLAGMALARLPRLSVQPVTDTEVAARLPDGRPRLGHPSDRSTPPCRGGSYGIRVPLYGPAGDRSVTMESLFG
jgi:predicted RNA-binding protein with PUA-like domain